MPALDRIAEVLLIGLILLTPLPLGAVGPTAVFAFSSVAAVLACGVLPRRGPFPTLKGGSTGVTRAAASVACLAALLPLAPLPAGIVRFLSPAAASLRDAVPGGGPSWMTLSVHPGATSTALARLAIYAAIFLGSAALASHGSTHRRILAAVFASGLFQAAYGSAEYLTGHQYILFSPKRYYLEDATGTYINKNHFAGLLEMALPVGLGLLLDRLQRSEKRGPFRGLRSRLVALVALTSDEGARSVTLSAGVAVMGLGLFLSHSRSGIASAALGILLVSWTSLRRARTARVRSLILGAGVVLGAVVLVTGLERVLSESSRLLTAATLVEGRLPVWRDCLSIASQFPLFGTGPGTFRDIYPAYRTMTGELAYDHAHNDALELLVETGLVGSMLLLLLLLLFGRSVIRALRTVPAPVFPYFLGASAGATALLFHEATDFNLHIPANAIVFSVLTGTCAGLAFAPGQRLALVVGNTGEHAARARWPRTRADLVRALAVCLIFVAVLKLYENSRADRLFAEYKKIGTNSAAGLSPPAERRRIEILGRVIATRDLGSKAHAALALELASMAEREILADGAEDGRRGATDTNVEAALREVETALRENPTEIEAWFSGFHVAAHAALLGRPNTGEPGLAQRFIDGAIRCDPTSGRLRMRFALELLAMGNVEKAREMFHEALLRPGVDPHVAARQMLEGGLSPAAVLEAIPETFPALLTAPGRSSRAWPTRKDGLVRVSSTPSMPTPRSDL